MYKFEQEMRRNVPRYVDMLESLRRGAKVLYDSEGAMLIAEQGNAFILGACDPQQGKLALGSLPADAAMLVVRDREMWQYALQHTPFNHSSACAQVYYAEPLPMPAQGQLDIRHPDPADWPAVRDAYHLIDAEALRAHFDSPDFFAGYYRGQLVAFVGLHDEGAMGMLYVFPAYRRMGFGDEMCAFMVNRQRELGRYAYAHVFVDNTPSLALQRKKHMTFADCTVWWMWHEDAKE